MAAKRGSGVPKAKEDTAAVEERATEVLQRLHRLYPDADCELEWDNPLELLVATILSAQCTDERVNRVTETLFARYHTAADYAQADPAVLEQELRPTGFYRNKTKLVMGAAGKIADDFGGEVPATMEALLTLPGVARKTANLVLGTAFGKATGVVVDTHVRRVANRLGLTRHDDPEKIERDLVALLPQDEWVFAGHALIWHGRRVCQARKPRCESCGLAEVCPRVGVGDG